MCQVLEMYSCTSCRTLLSNLVFPSLLQSALLSSALCVCVCWGGGGGGAFFPSALCEQEKKIIVSSGYRHLDMLEI